jgi:positive regulator of sigma E activity
VDDLYRYLKLLGLSIIFFGIVPLAGFLVSGSLKHAWEYSKVWLKCMAILVAVGGVLSLIALSF